MYIPQKVFWQALMTSVKQLGSIEISYWGKCTLLFPFHKFFLSFFEVWIQISVFLHHNVMTFVFLTTILLKPWQSKKDQLFVGMLQKNFFFELPPLTRCLIISFFFSFFLSYISGILLRRQIVKCSSENCWFLVRCFFSVIWNISQINIFKTKCKLKCQNDFFGKLFLKSGNTSVYILCFHYWDLSDEHLTW